MWSLVQILDDLALERVATFLDWRSLLMFGQVCQTTQVLARKQVIQRDAATATDGKSTAPTALQRLILSCLCQEKIDWLESNIRSDDDADTTNSSGLLLPWARYSPKTPPSITEYFVRFTVRSAAYGPPGCSVVAWQGFVPARCWDGDENTGSSILKIAVQENKRRWAADNNDPGAYTFMSEFLHFFLGTAEKSLELDLRRCCFGATDTLQDLLLVRSAFATAWPSEIIGRVSLVRADIIIPDINNNNSKRNRNRFCVRPLFPTPLLLRRRPHPSNSSQQQQQEVIESPTLQLVLLNDQEHYGPEYDDDSSYTTPVLAIDASTGDWLSLTLAYMH